jgi:hypothetical protein
MEHIEDNLLDQYALGNLPRESITELEEHVLACSFCQRRLVEVDEFLILFRVGATLEDGGTAPQWINAFTPRNLLWPGAATALAILLMFLTTGDSHHARLPPAILLLQSLRGPEAGAEMASARPYLLVFDMAAPASREAYEIEIVDTVGNEVLKRDAEARDGRITALIERLARGSYWVRVYRKQPGRKLLAEYSLQQK